MRGSREGARQYTGGIANAGQQKVGWVERLRETQHGANAYLSTPATSFAVRLTAAITA
jgi:hypothetical protein